MPHLGPTELIIILVIVLLIFGAGKLATLGGALGKGVRDFRGAMKEGEEEDESTSEPEPKKAKVAPAAEAPESGEESQS